MKARNILSIIAVLMGEAIILGAFFLWRGENTPDNIFIMNMVVTSLVYFICFYDVVFPLINTKDPSQRQVGALGIRWVVTGSYAVLALFAMLLLNKVFHTVFIVQLIIHGILLFLFVLGIAGVLHSSGKVASVHDRQMADRKGIEEMKYVTASFEDRLYMCTDVPQEMFAKITDIKNSIRYISPSNNTEAYGLEQKFVEIMQDAISKLSDYAGNRVEIEKSITYAVRILNGRKQIYSN